MLKKWNAVCSWLLTLLLMGHLLVMSYSMWTGWYAYGLCKMLARGTALAAGAHAALTLAIFFFVNGGTGPGRYGRQNLREMCRGCAMVINGRPGLACGTFIDTGQSSLLVLEPLTKFPVVTDLVVDRSILQEYQREAMMYLGTRATPDQKEYARQYSAAKCLRCGLCLEVCPNYVPSSREFFGASFANSAYLLYSSSEDRKKEIRKQYARHFEAGCSKSLACRDICPAHLPTLSSIAYMNRHSR